MYLPSSSLPEADYEATLVLLSVVIEKYSSEAACILSGDFNRSLFRKSSTDKKFQQFCSEMGLLPAEGSTDQPTYHGYNGSTSRIDYVLLHRDSCTSFGLKTENVNILNHICKDDNSDIISTHDALYFEIEVPQIVNENESAKDLEVYDIETRKLKWEECDTGLYGSSLEKLLEETFDLWEAPENFQVLASVIPNCFLQAAEIAVPSKQTRKSTFKINKSPEWRSAELDAKNALNKWKTDGKPKNDESITFKNKKESQSNLRKAIKEHNLKANIEENNTLMQANFRDPKLFSKLVNKKRMKNQGHTSMLKVNDVEYRGDNQVLAGFFEFHNDNSNPPPVSKSDESYTYYYATINVSAISYIVEQRNWKLPQLDIDQVENLIARLKNNKSPDFSGFSTTHVKKGGRTAAYFLMTYLNLSF